MRAAPPRRGASLGICYVAEGRRELAQPILLAVLPALERTPSCPVGLVRQSREALGRLGGVVAAR